MSQLVEYRLDGPVATLQLDDGKANVMSPSMLSALNAALDRAEGDRAVVVLAGRNSMLSAGFDLKILNTGGLNTLRMMASGFRLTARLLSFPTPVVVACTGHALAMGLFLVLCGDYRVGAKGDYRLAANEVAIGLPMPRVGVTVCRQGLHPAHFPRVALLSEEYGPEQGIAAGILDEVVSAGEVVALAQAKARSLAELDLRAYRLTKRRANAATVRAIRKAIAPDLKDIFFEGMRRVVESRFA